MWQLQAAAAVLLALVLYLGASAFSRRDGFWTRGRSVPPDEQARPTEAHGLGATGVEPLPWGEAYLPPLYCAEDVQAAAGTGRRGRREGWQHSAFQRGWRRHRRGWHEPAWRWCPCPGGGVGRLCRCRPAWLRQAPADWLYPGLGVLSR